MISSYVGENKMFERQFLRASSRSSYARRARWPSGSAPAAPASRRSTRRPATARRSPRARRRASSTGARTCSSTRCAPTSRIVKAWKGDRYGNLVYRKTTRNFNPMMARRRQDHHRRGRGAGRGRRARSRSASTRPASTCSASSRARTTRSRSSSAPSARGAPDHARPDPRPDRPARRRASCATAST